MNCRVRVICGLICICFAASFGLRQTARKSIKLEPSEFYPDDWNKGFDEADPPSDAVLDALLKTHEAKENWDRLKSLDRDRLRKIFLVVRVHLTDFNEKDEVVLGSDPLSGADCYWFWIVRDKGDHAQVLLFTNDYGIDLLRTKTNGCREIKGVWNSAAGYLITRLYRYDGSRYRLAYKHTRQEPLPKAKQ